MEAVYVSIIAGVAGGFTRAIIGYLNRPNGEAFRPKAFIRSIIISSLAGAFLAYQLNTAPIETFFAAVGSDWIVKEGYDALKG